MNSEIPAAPRKSGFPMWLIAVGVVLVCLAVVGVGACLLTVGGLTLAGPEIGQSFATILIGLECEAQGDGTDQECTNWAEEVSRNNSSVLETCSEVYSDDAPAMYQCVVDEVGRP